jgi:hypothetical protein
VKNLEEKENNKTKNKNKRAEEIAKIMVENMKANMKNPNFLIEKEERLQKAAHKVIKRRKEREKSED